MKKLVVLATISFFSFSCGSEISEEKKEEIIEMEEQNVALGNEIDQVITIENELDSLEQELDEIIN